MSCLGKTCTVQHRNIHCRGGKLTQEIDGLRADLKASQDLAKKLKAAAHTYAELAVECAIGKMPSEELQARCREAKALLDGLDPEVC